MKSWKTLPFPMRYKMQYNAKVNLLFSQNFVGHSSQLDVCPTIFTVRYHPFNGHDYTERSMLDILIRKIRVIRGFIVLMTPSSAQKKC